MSFQNQGKKQNPLFSAAVTGGIDDLGSGIVLATAEKPVFTIGTAPVINDLDNFSEVSLDRDGNSEVGSGPFYSNPLAELDSYANLQNFQDAPTLDLDINSNAQQQFNDQQVDGNTNPITALGSAASTVFSQFSSTFSNIIMGSASQAKFEETQIQPLPPPPAPVGELDLNINSNPYGNYGYPINQSEPNAPIPTFFAPGDENLFKKTEIEQPSNTFRLGSNKKKTYAHIPGLNASQNAQNVPQNFNLNPVMPPMPPQSVTHVDSMANFQPPAPINPYQNQSQQNYQEVSSEKTTSNKFSFSSLLDKIPVTKTLFGSSSDENNYPQSQDQKPQQYGYEDFSVTSQSYFAPTVQNQQSNENQPPINFFNQQNYSVPSAQQSPSSNEIQTENVMPVNFFNPQQFNTSPCAKVQQPSSQNENLGQVAMAHSLPQVTHVPLSSNQGTFIGVQQPSVSLMFNNNPQQIPMATPNYPNTISPALNPVQEPPKMETVFSPPPVAQVTTPVITQPPMQNVQQAAFPPMNSFTPQSFSTPPNVSITDAAPSPISFFNPSETSELFKARHGDDGKPKNPYSNNRARGVGLYKPRSSLTSESTSANLPPAPSNISSQVYTQPQQQFFTPQPTQLPESALTRPPSLPQQIDEPKQNTSPIMLVESTPPIASDASLMPSQPIVNDAPVIQKKSDLNVPEMENVVEQFQVQPSAPVVSETNVSNFFGSETATNKVSEQVSALDFFQATEAVQQVANFPPPKPLDSAVDPINFFSMSNEDKNEIQIQQQEQKQFDMKTEEFSSPAVTSSTLQTSTLMNDTALMNDITDKMESLSACSRSTLSLFATSELDSTAALKRTSNLESLIPKYLETQQQQQQQSEISQNERPLSTSPGLNKCYRPVYCHWFYQNLYWHPFSMTDSLAIENAIAENLEVICTNGARCEVNIKERRRASIYWPSGLNAIRKCSWFFMDTLTESRNLIPYEENIAECLEEEYKKALNNSRWNHRIHLPELLPQQDFIIIKDAATIEHHKMGQILIVKRGLDEFDIVDGEEGTADHLILCISTFGDKIDDNADEIRSKCLEIIQQYYSEAFDSGQISRIEVLPIALNSIDVLKMFELSATLENATSVRSLSRDVGRHVMRTMLYSNENFYQKIMNHLAFSLNEIVSKFRQRNSTFGGEISLISASYEALFLFDLLLANQNSDGSDFWKLNFTVSKFFACGMPISLLTIRNGERLKHEFEFTICKKFFNILHPFDPIGQRIEPLIIPEYASLPPENIENLSSTMCERIDFILPEDSILETFSTSVYYTSEILMRSLTNEIYGANKMDSGSL